MAVDTSSEPIGNTPSRAAGNVSGAPELSTGGEAGGPSEAPRPDVTTVSGPGSEGEPSGAQIAAEESDDPELARRGADVQSEPA